MMEAKAFEPEDPMELVGFAAPPLTEADMEEMAESIVDEYMRLGWDDTDILKLFRRPTYPITHALYRIHGEGHIGSVIEKVRRQWGNTWRFRDEVTDDSPEDLEGLESDGAFVPLEAVFKGAQ